MKFSDKRTVRIITGRGLVDFLESELAGQGFEATEKTDNSIEIHASMTDCMRLNLTLRCATYILYELERFTSRNADELYRRLSKLPWEEMIDPDGYISIVSRVDNPSINNTMFPNLKAKDAVCDRLMKKVGRRPDSGPERGRTVLQLYWKGSQARIYINTSGQKISDRNYRKMPGKAPLREPLAAGIIQAMEYDGTKPLVNPMCGSGTLAIEAALIAAGRHPGLLRSNFGFMHIKGFDTGQWDDIRRQVSKESRKGAAGGSAPIIATDIDPGMVEAARKNAMTAGVEQLIEFDTCDFADTRIPDEAGLIVMNPEYGLRLGDTKELEKTYGRIGDFLKTSCTGYLAGIFTGNLKLAKCVGLQTRRRIPFFNADIECRLLIYEMYRGSRKAKYDETGKP